MSDDSSKRVEKAFENIKEGAQEEELYFDPETGQLVVRNTTSTALVTQDHLPRPEWLRKGSSSADAGPTAQSADRPAESPGRCPRSGIRMTSVTSTHNDTPMPSRGTNRWQDPIRKRALRVTAAQDKDARQRKRDEQQTRRHVVARDVSERARDHIDQRDDQLNQHAAVRCNAFRRHPPGKREKSLPAPSRRKAGTRKSYEAHKLDTTTRPAKASATLRVPPLLTAAGCSYQQALPSATRRGSPHLRTIHRNHDHDGADQSACQRQRLRDGLSRNDHEVLPCGVGPKDGDHRRAHQRAL